MGFGIGPQEMFFFGIIALLLFGKRLPEVARNLGKGLTEFKKGMKGVEEDFRTAYRETERNDPPPRRPDPISEADRELRAPKFEPPTTEPISTGSETAP